MDERLQLPPIHFQKRESFGLSDEWSRHHQFFPLALHEEETAEEELLVWSNYVYGKNKEYRRISEDNKRKRKKKVSFDIDYLRDYDDSEDRGFYDQGLDDQGHYDRAVYDQLEIEEENRLTRGRKAGIGGMFRGEDADERFDRVFPNPPLPVDEPIEKDAEDEIEEEDKLNRFSPDYYQTRGSMESDDSAYNTFNSLSRLSPMRSSTASAMSSLPLRPATAPFTISSSTLSPPKVCTKEARYPRLPPQWMESGNKRTVEVV